MNWELARSVTAEETIATGTGIRELKRPGDRYGGEAWRKRNGIARVRFLPAGPVLLAEVHWYEAHGVGKVEMKIKTLL